MGRRSIRFDFIKEELWRKIPKSISTELRSYRAYYSNYVQEQNKINELELEIDKCKVKMEKYRIQMHKKNKDIDYLREEFTYWVSLVKQKQKGKYNYYMICIARTNSTTKNIYLGNEVKITARLKEFYKKDKDRLKEVDKDWWGVLNEDVLNGFIYSKILDLIIEYSDGFQATTFNLDTVYPIKGRRGV